jgi:lipopolysaccharide transport system ATP-binding protein
MWALRDVSFSVPAGSSIGVIGSNGAGKSTLLRLCAGLGRPTRGRVLRTGDASSVLRLGDLFDPSLTGRENAVTAAMIAGMRGRKARATVPAILDFAEIEEFGDAPVWTYSDGMRLRLAFGVIAQLRPSTLVLDEVIAVGDLRFQAKCLDYVRELRAGGSTLVLASHNLEQVVAECDQAIWLQGGGVRATGEAAAVVESYRTAMLSETYERTPVPAAGSVGQLLELRRNRLGSQEVVIDEVRLLRADGTEGSEIRVGDSLAVAVTAVSHSGAVRDAIVAVAIRRKADAVVCCDSNTETDAVSLGDLTHPTTIALEYERLDLLPGEYDVEVGVYARDWEYAYDVHFDVYPLRVGGRTEASGILAVPHRWRPPNSPIG